jgi:hypothetical protein
MPDDGLILLLPEAGGPPCAAWRIAEEQAVAIPADAGLVGWPDRVTALAPPGAMPVLCQPIEDAATPAQALGLARLAAADAALAHGSLALAALEDGMVLTARIDPARLEAWQQAVVATVGRPADALVPAALVLPPPAAGTVYRAALGAWTLRARLWRLSRPNHRCGRRWCCLTCAWCPVPMPLWPGAWRRRTRGLGSMCWARPRSRPLRRHGDWPGSPCWYCSWRWPCRWRRSRAGEWPPLMPRRTRWRKCAPASPVWRT